jgi:sigma-B regulation protein RsbU (phosphoserine phosphatase)
VSGKGVPAALFMMMVKTLIKDQLELGLNPSEAFIKINNKLNDGNSEDMFVTVWLGLLNINSGEMTYVNAGHPPPFLFNKSTNQYKTLESNPNFVLGGMENMDYKSSEIKINTGDRLYLFTDGITESINQNEEEFSDKRLANILNENHTLKIKELIFKISNELHNFSKDVEQFDDETMLILEYKKKN